MNHDIVPELKALFADKLSVVVDSSDSDLLETGVVDSATLVNLLLELEQRFNLRFNFETLEIDSFRSLTTIARLVRGQKATDAGNGAEH